MLSGIIQSCYDSHMLSSLIPTIRSCVAKETVGMNSILDLGCGSNSFVPHVVNCSELVGVEGHAASARVAMESGLYSKIIQADLTQVDFLENSFDGVVLIEVIEHLSYEDGYRLIQKAKKWARKKLIISTPSGFWPQGALQGNEYQRHVSGWTSDDLEAMDMRVNGLAGLKLLRKENSGEIVDGGVLALSDTLKWRPWQLQLALAALSQIFVFRYPKLAFELFAVWEKSINN